MTGSPFRFRRLLASSSSRIELGAVGKSGQHVMPRQVDDLGLRAPPLGDVLDDGDPAAAFHRLPAKEHEPPVRQFIDPAGIG